MTHKKSLFLTVLEPWEVQVQGTNRFNVWLAFSLTAIVSLYPHKRQGIFLGSLIPFVRARISKFMGAWHPEGSAPGGAWHIWLRLGPQHRPPRRTCQAPSPHRATPSTPCWPCPHAERPACREQLLKSYFPDIKSLSGFSPNKHNAEPEKGVK